MFPSITPSWLLLQERAVTQIVQATLGMRAEAHQQWNHSALWAVEECHLEILGAHPVTGRQTAARAGGPRTGEWLWVYPWHYKHFSTVFTVENHCHHHSVYLASRNLFLSVNVAFRAQACYRFLSCHYMKERERYKHSQSVLLMREVAIIITLLLHCSSHGQMQVPLPSLLLHKVTNTGYWEWNIGVWGRLLGVF